MPEAIDHLIVFDTGVAPTLVTRGVTAAHEANVGRSCSRGDHELTA